MKLKYITLLFTLFIIITFLFTENYIKDEHFGRVDITKINDAYKNIEEELNKKIENQTNDIKNKDLENLEEKYDCNIIMLKDAKYQSVVYDAIKNGRILMDYYNSDKIIGKIIFKGKSDIYKSMTKDLQKKISLIFISILLLGYVYIYIIYRNIVLPFNKLKNFAGNITRGNLDIPLQINKNNYFGSFTESFDIMREELKKAREGEYRANQNKKELVGSLSHYIKTPISTIKAICEILLIKIKDKEILEKIKIIDNKANTIDKLINNLFHATLDELEVLEIEKNEELSTIIPIMFEEINYYNKIKFKNSIPNCLIYADKLRLNEVIDNIINNSYKYANTDIEVTFYKTEDGIEIFIKDSGEGVEEDELLLITQKYYRGENTEGKSGSGLGLFLANLFMEGMDGEINFYNDNGFVAVLFLKKV